MIVRSGGYDYSTTLPRAALLLVLAWLLLAALWSLLRLPFRIWGRYRKRQGRARLLEGLRALQGGHWQRAERLLGTAATDREAGALALAAAVRAADGRGDEAAAQRWLTALAERDPATHAMLVAERLLEQGLPVDAINALDVAAARSLPPPRGLLLRARALRAIGRAGEAYGLLGALRQQSALPDAALARLEMELATQSLREAADANLLAERWEAMPKPLRVEPGVVAAYAERAAALRWDEAALRQLEQALDARWDESLADLYGRLAWAMWIRAAPARSAGCRPTRPARHCWSRWPDWHASRASGCRRRTSCTVPWPGAPAPKPGKRWARASPPPARKTWPGAPTPTHCARRAAR